MPKLLVEPSILEFRLRIIGNVDRLIATTLFTWLAMHSVQLNSAARPSKSDYLDISKQSVYSKEKNI